MTYGKCIKQAREAKRFTQEQLAEELDISRQAVSKWEADLSRPTREKLDRLSELLDIPPSTWAEIDAELEAANRPPDNSRPWKIATAALAAVCLVLAVCLAAVLWPREYPDQADSPAPSENDIHIPLSNEDLSAPTDPSAILPDTIPLTVRRDFDFGDWLLGEYGLDEIPFLNNSEQVTESELWYGLFPDGTRLSLVPAPAYWDESGQRFHIYLLYAPPADGAPDYQILYRISEDHMGDDYGEWEAEEFSNVLGHSGFKVTMSHADNFYRDSHYIIQRPDGTPCMMMISGAAGYEADVDDDGELEIVSYSKYDPSWEITDTIGGEEGSFIYTLDASPPDLPAGATLDFGPGRGGFVVTDSNDVVRCRYALREGEMVRLPLTDFSALDYPDAAGTKLTFITDPDVAGILTDGIDPDEILPYTEDVSITHRQQAYMALQELYNLTGLTVDECYCAANKHGVLFSLLPDGFDQRSFLSFDFNTRYGNTDHIPSIHISWKELGDDWSPLSLADAIRPEAWVNADSGEEVLLWYYGRMQFFSTGAPAYANDGELWLENGDLYVYYMGDAEAYGPVLWGITGPYPDGEVNH